MAGDITNICNGTPAVCQIVIVFALTWQCLGLVVIFASLVGMQFSGKGKMHALFWVSIVCAISDS